jgi:hypothetical protein
MGKELSHQLAPGDVFIENTPGARVVFTVFKLIDAHIRLSIEGDSMEKAYVEGEIYLDLKSLAQSKRESILFQAFMKDLFPSEEHTDCLFLRLRSPRGGIYVFRYDGRLRELRGSFLQERIRGETELVLKMGPQNPQGYCSRAISTI